MKARWLHRAGAHWPEYLIESALLAVFMMSACTTTVLIEHPSSPVVGLVKNPDIRRALIGMVMGITAIMLIYSPWGQRSGAHFNPAVTLAYLRLGKIEASDAAGYVAAQCAGAIAGVELSRRLLGEMVAHPAVGYAVTVPGAAGSAAAFLAELAISFLLMTVVLLVSNSRWSRWTGACCGTLVFLYITFEAPLSGMSMNPARTLGSAYVSHVWTSWWIYLLAPPLGMLTAVELYRRSFAMRACANLNHGNGSTRPCHFCKPLAH